MKKTYFCQKKIKRKILTMLVFGILFLSLGNIVEGAETHTVQKGDNLWLISLQYNVDFQELLAANEDIINHDYILPAQKIIIPSRDSEQASETLATREGSRTIPSNSLGFSPQQIDLLARLVHSEAGGEPYMGKVAVAASVLNRLESPLYPNTLSGVIYQVINGSYQYSPVLDGRINLPASKSAYEAVYEALSGTDPSCNALGFYNPSKTSNRWVRQQQVTAVIGNHIFFR